MSAPTTDVDPLGPTEAVGTVPDPDVPSAGDATPSERPGRPERDADEVDDAASAPGGVLLVCLAAMLASAGAAWMIAGVFDGNVARGFALMGPVAGAALVYGSYRLQRPGTLQYLTLPFALLLGAVAVLPDSSTGASLPSLVSDALFSGGIGQPPVPFDPGWRFVLVVLSTLLAAGAASLALGYDRPNLAVGLPAPLVVATSLVQPEGAELVSTVVAFVLVVAGLTVAYGVELARSGVSSGRFEAKRLLRGLVALLGLAGGLVVLASLASFLLPESRSEQVVPPQRPPQAPAQLDRELFTVEADRRLPWRLGVLDVYEDNAWKTPPFDPARLVEVDGEIAGAQGLNQPDEVVTFEIRDIGGRVLPTLAVPRSIDVDGAATLQYDPRTQALRSAALAEEGLRYTVVAAAPADVASLQAAPPPRDEVREFLEIPDPPPAIEDLLRDLPDADDFTRLQAAREVYYDNVLAAGAGNPVDVSPERVAEMLEGKEATPYEISAGEALLARWVGVPSRLGYGYFGGDELDDGSGYSVRPAHGATWLEVYFEGEGWTPIVGKPPRAKSSFSDAQKNEDPSVRPTDELALITYVPIRLRSLTLLFEVVRFYLLQVIPLLLLLGVAIAFYPGLLRRLRRYRRNRWADARGPQGHLAVAYAEMRDTAWDLNIGQPADTPLQFVERLTPDEEHAELAWLVTRGLWGDLRRGLTAEDAAEARAMARSVQRRMVEAQPAVARVIGAASRASLRAPYSDDLPNAWVELRLGQRLAWPFRKLGRGVLWLVRRLDPRRLGRRAGAGVTSVLPLVLLVALVLSACTEPLDVATPSDAAAVPSPAVPDQVDDIVLQREPSAETPFAEGGEDALVTYGEVYTVRRDDTIEASVQIGAFRPGLYQREQQVRDGLLRALGGGRFEPIRLGDDRVQTLQSIEQKLLLWFSPNGRYYVLVVARQAFEDAEPLLQAILAFQRGERDLTLEDVSQATADDPRRGIPG